MTRQDLLSSGRDLLEMLAVELKRDIMPPRSRSTAQQQFSVHDGDEGGQMAPAAGGRRFVSTRSDLEEGPEWEVTEEGAAVMASRRQLGAAAGPSLLPMAALQLDGTTSAEMSQQALMLQQGRDPRDPGCLPRTRLNK